MNAGAMLLGLVALRVDNLLAFAWHARLRKELYPRGVWPPSAVREGIYRIARATVRPQA